MVWKHKNGAAGNFWYAKENPKVLPLSEKVQVLDLISKEKIPYDEVAQVYGKNVFSRHQITFITVYNCCELLISNWTIFMNWALRLGTISLHQLVIYLLQSMLTRILSKDLEENKVLHVKENMWKRKKNLRKKDNLREK